jgi:hypothetical protein
MSLDLGMQAQIRSMIFIAGEPIPFFWPMRAFIHHNPLHGLEKLPFEQAVSEGRKLFHGKGFLPRKIYRRYLDEGKIDIAAPHKEQGDSPETWTISTTSICATGWSSCSPR